ncbi:hypothetical protein [Undibacterium fentianense]|uniref:DUF4175 family protein n=1 Tax=Undibacterium fentianense TaxID=2828728 RepID=A0A941E2T1_9BURK|nr:hypothetical protein [Undibacterium fentianense]MBR7800406.1 hypothetical protein [Undibacterium fentianense]
MSAVLDRVPYQLLRQIIQHRLLIYLGACAPWIVLRSLIGLAICLFLIVCDVIWIWHQSKKHTIHWLHAFFPTFEDSLYLLCQTERVNPVASLQRERLQQRVTNLLTTDAIARVGQQVLRPSRMQLSIVFCCSLIAALLVSSFSTPKAFATRESKAVANPVAGLPSMRIKIRPPTYTGIAAFESTAKELQIPEHSAVEWCVVSTSLTPTQVQQIRQSSVRLSNGQEPKMEARAAGELCASWDASETVFWTWSADAKQQRYTLKVDLDQAPEIVISQPTELLQILSEQTQHVTMSMQIKDDYLVANASLHLTLARGSGENIRFSDKEFPIPKGNEGRQRQWTRRWSLSDLGMEPGDELYFFVKASDNAEKNPHSVRSPTYTIKLPAPDALADETSVLPVLAKPESLRSQRQIIIDTEQLLADVQANPRLSAEVIRHRSEVIANDQAALRRRYGRFLGEESSLFGDEHEDGEHANEKPATDLMAQYGHAHDQEENATLFDEATKKILRRALVAMWDAEKALRAITPKSALAPENKALEAIKQLQQADRIYLHKAAFTPPAIKEEKRLSGDVLDVKNKQRAQSLAESNVPVEVAELIQALGQQGALPALWSKSARAWIASHIVGDEQRLKAQAAVQDVIEGCQSCRAELAAWLRQSIASDGIRLQPEIRYQAAKASALDTYWQTQVKTSEQATQSKPLSEKQPASDPLQKQKNMTRDRR